MSYEEIASRTDARHIRESLSTKLGPITRVGEAADGLRGQTMDFNAFDDLEDTPVLTSSSALPLRLYDFTWGDSIYECFLSCQNEC